MRSIEDLLKISRSIEKEVCVDRDGVVLRRYYRFRPSKNYGGSAVGDVVGCNLRCIYCWCWFINSRTWFGSYELPQNVVEKLLLIAREGKYNVVRLSCGEPVLCFDHLINILNFFSLKRKTEVFILETNGILLGLYEDYVYKLKPYELFLIVRISVKGCTEEDFEKITGFDRSVFLYQVKAIEYLDLLNIPYVIAIPISLCSRQGFAKLIEVLSNYVGEHVLNVVEPEVLILYPSVVTRLCRKGLKPWIAYDPVAKEKVGGGDIDKLFERLCREKS